MTAPKKIEDLHVKIFGDGAHEQDMLDMADKPYIKGFTTNPSLMRAAGVTDYVAFAKDVLSKIHDKPISFEVFSDDFVEMERQARIIATWGENPGDEYKGRILSSARQNSFARWYEIKRHRHFNCRTSGCGR
jgi:transaldolase